MPHRKSYIATLFDGGTRRKTRTRCRAYDSKSVSRVLSEGGLHVLKVQPHWLYRLKYAVLVVLGAGAVLGLAALVLRIIESVNG